MPYVLRVQRLEALDTFAREAFVSGPDASQEACDFVLALALVFNDLRDVLMAHQLLSEHRPADEDRVSEELGLFNGLRTTLIRAQSGVVNELLALIGVNDGALAEPIIGSLPDHMSKNGRKAWAALRDVAAGRSNRDPFAKVLVRVRNKVAFHYDAAEIGAGYRNAFGPHARHGEPFISRGGTHSGSRFYFADAAAQAYMFDQASDGDARAFLLGESPLFDVMFEAIYEIVTCFVQARGFAWRPLRQGSLPPGYGSD